jgi:uncharacterized protein
MNTQKCSWSFRALALVLAISAFVATESRAQNGPITSRLNKVLLYFYNYGTDHTNTPNYVRYVRDLGIEHGFQVDTTRSPASFTPATLSQYDVIFLFSAYYFGRNMSTAQKTAVENWYADNKGIACFHQCVRNEWGGTYPNWYDNLMGVQYTTFAGFGNGPVYVDTSVVGTDLAMDVAKTPYAANYRIVWNDEWYTYGAVVTNLPNSKAILRTNKAGHVGSRNWNTSQPDSGIVMAWSREVQGGRYVLSSFFHTNGPIAGKGGLTGTRPDSLARFIDGHYLGVMRYLAGYTGCTDSTKANYNPKATHNDTAICNQGTGIHIAGNAASKNIKIGDFKVSISETGAHVVEVFNLRGGKLVSYRGTGPREYRFPQIRSPGTYYVRVKAPSGAVNKKLFLF